LTREEWRALRRLKAAIDQRFMIVAKGQTTPRLLGDHRPSVAG
jgi:hypothetical protein